MEEKMLWNIGAKKTEFKLSRFLFHIEMKQTNYNESFFEFAIGSYFDELEEQKTITIRTVF